MRFATLRYWSIVVVAVLSLCVRQEIQAGGPIQFNEEDGRIFHWPFDTAFYVVESGPLGVFNNQQLKESVDRSFRTWEQVPTSGLFVSNQIGVPNLIPAERLAPFQKDITVEDFATRVTCPILPGEPADFQRSRIDCQLLTACVLEQNGIACPSPIIFDDPKDCSANSSENSIIKEFFGGDNSVIGFTNPFLTISPAPQVPEPFKATIVQAYVVISGCFFSQSVLNDLNITNIEGAQRFLESVLVHEFGHFVGLAHSSVNGDIALLNPSVKRLGISRTTIGGTPQVFGPLDPLTSVDANSVESMYPVNLTDPQQPAKQAILEKDDEFSLATVYPCTDQSPKKQAGQCRSLSDGTGTIAGNVFMLQTGQSTPQPAQGVLVIARRVDGDDRNVFVLKQAISQLTGNTFAPARCTGQINFDRDSNGVPDFSLSGLFGPCTTDEQCTTEMNAEGGLIPGLSAIVNSSTGTTITGEFVGRCGYTSAGFSTSQPVGDGREGSFSLAGLEPGSYMVQALPVTCPGCSFSSPMRSSLGIIDFVNGVFSDTISLSPVSASPIIQSDSNRALTFFPNPQTGEFYNGPATGCAGTTSPCGNEAASSTDNPFAYTPIVVTAGNQVTNINIFLNTSPANTFSDPGFNFCQLADINSDGKVNEKDILAVSKARANYEKKQKISNPRTDLNQDNTVTFIDVDIAADLVAIPRPFDNPGSGIASSGNTSELKRGIATFDAICSAAKAGGCEIQAPAEDIQNTGKPSDFTCRSATTIGCKVTGCP